MASRQWLIAIAASLASTCAIAALEPLEESIETALTSVTLPAHEASQVVIRECPSCDAAVYRVTARTRYAIGNSAVSLDELRATASNGGSQSLVYIFYGVDDGFVTRIVLDLFD